MFQVYQDDLLLQNTHNLLYLMQQYHNRSSIADEMRVLLQCHCFFVSARGSQQAKEVVSTWADGSGRWLAGVTTLKLASHILHTQDLEAC